jgi:hypothetical protein
MRWEKAARQDHKHNEGKTLNKVHLKICCTSALFSSVSFIGQGGLATMTSQCHIIFCFGFGVCNML